MFSVNLLRIFFGCLRKKFAILMRKVAISQAASQEQKGAQIVLSVVYCISATLFAFCSPLGCHLSVCLDTFWRIGNEARNITNLRGISSIFVSLLLTQKAIGDHQKDVKTQYFRQRRHVSISFLYKLVRLLALNCVLNSN